MAHSRAELVGEKYEFYEGRVNEAQGDLVLLHNTHVRRNCGDKQCRSMTARSNDVTNIEMRVLTNKLNC